MKTQILLITAGLGVLALVAQANAEDCRIPEGRSALETALNNSKVQLEDVTRRIKAHHAKRELTSEERLDLSVLNAESKRLQICGLRYENALLKQEVARLNQQNENCKNRLQQGCAAGMAGPAPAGFGGPAPAGAGE